VRERLGPGAVRTGTAFVSFTESPAGVVVRVRDRSSGTLSELRGAFTTKSDIIAALLRAIDDEVLKRAAKRSEGQEKRDALFDIVMTRFDVLGPHKAALKSIHASGPADFALAGPFLSSQHWMLQAAGIATDGTTGALRVAGLGVTYASVFRTWLEDDDPGLARTMAALDSALARGQRWSNLFDDLLSVPSRLCPTRT